jgi:hypothetical protein
MFVRLSSRSLSSWAIDGKGDNVPERVKSLNREMNSIMEKQRVEAHSSNTDARHLRYPLRARWGVRG